MRAPAATAKVYSRAAGRACEGELSIGIAFHHFISRRLKCRRVLRESGELSGTWPGEKALRAVLFSVGELIADAPNRQHQLRVLRVVFDLRPQAIDVRINCSIVPFV
jgi:hypothetical protein